MSEKRSTWILRKNRGKPKWIKIANSGISREMTSDFICISLINHQYDDRD